MMKGLLANLYARRDCEAINSLYAPLRLGAAFFM